MASSEEDTLQVEREREDKSEMKIFCQNILEIKNKKYWNVRKFPLTCLKSNPFLFLEDQFVGGVDERKQKEKGKRKKKRKSENKGKSQKNEKKK